MPNPSQLNKSIELLAPAGSFEAMVAAVQNGADAVYMGFGDFNARRGAKNLSSDEMLQAVEYCRLRGVKTNITLNTLLTDRELARAEEIVKQINRIGADAVIVADWGLARMIRQVAPELPIHASTQMTIHSLDGVKYAAEHGFSRVVLSRELSREQISYICKNSPVEIEVFAHGALCMCYSGQCYLSGVIGGRSGNRGLCAQPCRLPYQFNEKGRQGHPLSLKDLCLAENLSELSSMGVKCLKIEGRMKRPEYVAIVTSIYSKLLHEGRKPTREELLLLEQVFSRQGFTRGYYLSKTGSDMFGIRTERDDSGLNKLYKQARESYKNESQRVGVRFYCVINVGDPITVAAEDSDGNRYIAKGPIAELAHTRGISADAVREQLRKTGGTPFSCAGVQVHAAENAAASLSAINALRRECLENLKKKRSAIPQRSEGMFITGFKLINQKEAPKITLSLTSVNQLSDELLSFNPALVCIPVHEAVSSPEIIAKASQKTTVAVTLPRIIWDNELPKVEEMLDAAHQMGITHAMAGNVAHFPILKKLHFEIHCDFGFNVFNSHSLKELKKSGAVSAVLSPELTFAQVRDIVKGIDTELIVYGRFPLMITENCVVKSQSGHCICSNANTLTDRTGAAFPIIREYPHRNVILNSQKLFLADKSDEYRNLGLWAVRLMFTTENSRECVQVMERYCGKDSGYTPTVYTRGLYRRGVE